MSLSEVLSTRPSPERERVYDRLLSDIVEGSLAPGSRLVEEGLARRLGVSRTPVREALFMLERDGFVGSELHRGFAVSPLAESTAREIYPMVGALEGLALVESGAALLGSNLESLKEANAELKAVRGNPRKAMHADGSFHRLMLRLCPNARLLAAIHGLHQQILRYEHVYMSDSSLIDISVGQHQSIIEAIERGDLAAAERAVRANYASGLAAVIVKLRQPG